MPERRRTREPLDLPAVSALDERQDLGAREATEAEAHGAEVVLYGHQTLPAELKETSGGVRQEGWWHWHHGRGTAVSR